MITNMFATFGWGKTTVVFLAVCLGCLGAGDRKLANAGNSSEHPLVFVAGPHLNSYPPTKGTFQFLLKDSRGRWEKRAHATFSQINKASLNTSPSAAMANPLPSLSLMLEDAYRLLE